MYQRILVPVDGSTTSQAGLDEAIRLAKLTGGTLRLLHVVDDLKCASGFETCATYYSDVLPLMRAAGEQVLSGAGQRVAASGLEADTVLAETFAQRTGDVIVDQAKAWGADVIVIGTHGRRGVERVLLGSDAEQVVRTAPVPVLLVRHFLIDARPTAGRA